MDDLSVKMPSQTPATQDARKPATIASDAPPFDAEGGSMAAPTVGISQSSDGGVDYANKQVGNTSDWQAADNKLSDGWQNASRQR